MTLLTATRPASRTDQHAPRSDGRAPVRKGTAAERLRIVTAPTTECRCLLAAVGRCPTQRGAPATTT